MSEPDICRLQCSELGTKRRRACRGDYDGDGRTDVAVFRPGNSTWYIVQSTAGILVQQFGQSGDIPTQTALNY